MIPKSSNRGIYSFGISIKTNWASNWSFVAFTVNAIRIFISIFTTPYIHQNKTIDIWNGQVSGISHQIRQALGLDSDNVSSRLGSIIKGNFSWDDIAVAISS